MLSRRHRIALLDAAAEQVLVVDGELPQHPDEWPSPPELRSTIGAAVALPAAAPWRTPDGTVTHVLVGDGRASLDGAVWRPVAEAGVPGLAGAAARWRAGARADGEAAWFARGWQEEVLAWIDGVLAERGRERCGTPELRTAWSLSAVLRVPATGGELWFKAACECYRAEPALTAAVHRIDPGLTPVPVAVDVERGWVLLEPIPGAADGVEAEYAPEVARRFAQLQLASRAHTAALRAAGAPDRGLEGTLAMLGEVLHHSVDLLTPAQRAIAPSLESALVKALQELWDGALPDTLAHGDLHVFNVARTDAGPVVFDWTDLCLSHPFLDAHHLATSAGPEVADAVWSAYLGPWRAAYPDVDLDAVRARVPVAETAFQAITYEQLYRSQPEVSRWELATFVGGCIERLATFVGG